MIYFYNIFCKDKNITRTFIESTSNIIEAYRRHEDYCNNKNNPDKYNKFKYKFIREYGGWNNWECEIIDKCHKKDRYEMEYFYFKNNSVKKIPDDESNELVVEKINIIPPTTNLDGKPYSVKKHHDCECGGKFTTANRMQHYRSTKHLKYRSKIGK